MPSLTNARFSSRSLARRAVQFISLSIVLCALVLLAAGPAAAGQAGSSTPPTTYTFTTFQPFSATQFSATAIDNTGDVAGFYLNSSKVYEGYERLENATFDTIDDTKTLNTEAAGISSKGTAIVGNVCIKIECQTHSDATPPGERHGCTCTNTEGFLYKNGAFKEYEFQKVPNTAIDAVNDKGVFVGSYIDPTTKLVTGFISNGTTISYQSSGTTLTAINDAGVIIGNDSSASFKANTSGKILGTFAFPGATSTTARGINNPGVVVGSFVDSAGLTHGFVYQKGAYTQLDAPLGVGATTAFGINDSGSIVGTYFDSSQKLWGFIATP